MTKVILYIATSLDGFIARSDGSTEWLNRYMSTTDTDYGRSRVLDSVGAVALGARAFECIADSATWPYQGKKCYVFSHREMRSRTPVMWWKKGPRDLLERLELYGHDLWLVGGGELARSFLNAGCIDKIVISVIPEKITEGKALFLEPLPESQWELSGIKNYVNGVRQFVYAHKP